MLCSFVSASTGWSLHAQAMQFLVILLLRFAYHAAMSSRVLRAIVSPGSSQVPPDPPHCTVPRRHAAFASTCPHFRLRRECSGVLPCCWRLLWRTLVSAGGVCAPTAYNLRQPACNACTGGACDTHQHRIMAWLMGPSPRFTGPARGGKHRASGRVALLTLCVAHCMPCRPYARCNIGGLLLVAFYDSWQSDPPTQSADVEAHRSNLDADALPTCAADRRRVADNTQHSTCGMQHGAQQPAACAQALSSTLRGRLETTTPMAERASSAERASFERAEPVSLAPSARPEYSEYPHVST
jgi:hypothetical protein